MLAFAITISRETRREGCRAASERPSRRVRRATSSRLPNRLLARQRLRLARLSIREVLEGPSTTCRQKAIDVVCGRVTLPAPILRVAGTSKRIGPRATKMEVGAAGTALEITILVPNDSETETKGRERTYVASKRSLALVVPSHGSRRAVRSDVGHDAKVL